MPVRFYCPARSGDDYASDYEKKMFKKYNITEEHFKKHKDHERDYKIHNYGQGELDRLYRREFAEGKYKWVKSEYFQCRICGVIVHEGDC